jgi:MFS family permease
MTPARPSAAAPLQLPNFRRLWTAGLAVNLALWMQAVGASWLMLSLAPSPLMVALTQTAQSLPAFLFGLPAGVLADLVNRKALILWAYAGLAASAAIACVATSFDVMTAGLLLAVTAAIGAGFAIQAPAVHTSLAESVPRDLLFAALALSAISFNVARAVGPALAGAVVSAGGTVAVFALCALFFGSAFAAALRWRHPVRARDLPPERVLVGVRGALQYAQHSPVMKAQLLRTLMFVGSASGLWALLPVVARSRLGLGADGYGLLLGCLGAGAVMGSVVAVRLSRRWSLNAVGVASALIYTAGVAVVCSSLDMALVCISLVCAGAGWAVVGNVNLTAIQTSIPPWVRARAMALYLLVFQGSMAAGGALWGSAATRWSLEAALLASVLALAATALLMRALPARIGEEAEATPSPVSEIPPLSVAPEEQDGPVAVQVNYVIQTTDREEFLAVMQALGRSRRRDGALFWRIYRDLRQPHRYVERFVIRSWTDYLRQRSRMTEADRRVERRAQGMHVGPDEPEMQLMLAERTSGGAS